MTVGQVLGAVRARVGTNGRQEAGDALVGVADALLAGPGAPGWRPEWASLNPDERRAMAQTARAMGGVERAEHTVQQVRVVERAQREEAALLLQAAQTQDPAERARITQRLIELQTESGSNTASSFIRQGQQDARVAAGEARAAEQRDVQQQIQQSSVQDSLRRIQAVSPPPSPQDELGGEAGRAWNAMSGRPLPVQAVELGRLADRLTAEAEARGRLVAPRDNLLGHLDRGSNAGNSEVNQMLAREIAGDDFAAPAALQALPRLANSGVVPTDLDSQMQAAILSGDRARIMAFAGLHRQMMTDVRSERAYAQVVDNRVRDALDAFGRGLAFVPNDATRDDRIRQMVDAARDTVRATSANPSEVRARFGATPEVQAAAIRGHLEAGLSEAGLPTEMRGDMGRDYEREFLVASRTIANPAQAAAEALRRIGTVWSASSTTVSPDGLRATDTGMSLLGAMYAPFNPTALARQNPTWVQHDAARHVAVHSRNIFGGLRQANADWQQDLLDDMLRRGNGDPAASSLRLGVNARWLPVRGNGPEAFAIPGDESTRFYQLVRIENGMMEPVWTRGPNGEPGAQPFRVALGLEARRLNAASRGEREGAIDRAAGAAGMTRDGQWGRVQPGPADSAALDDASQGGVPASNPPRRPSGAGRSPRQVIEQERGPSELRRIMREGRQ